MAAAAMMIEPVLFFVKKFCGCFAEELLGIRRGFVGGGLDHDSAGL